MNRFSIEPQLRPQTYLQSALQSLSRITNTLNRSAVKYNISPSKSKPSQSPRQKFELDEISLSSIIEETQKCQKMLSQIMINNVPTVPYSKYVPNKPKTHRIQTNENKEQQLVNQVFEKLINSGYFPADKIYSPTKSIKSSGISSKCNEYNQINQINHINILIQKLGIASNQNDQLRRKVSNLEQMLVQKQISQINSQMKSAIQSSDDSMIKQLAQLRMEKARMNQEFQRQITKYNEVFKRIKHHNDLRQNEKRSSGMIDEILKENSKLLKEKEEDQKIIEELREKVLSKHKHLRNMSKTMSKLCFNSDLVNKL